MQGARLKPLGCFDVPDQLLVRGRSCRSRAAGVLGECLDRLRVPRIGVGQLVRARHRLQSLIRQGRMTPEEWLERAEKLSQAKLQRKSKKQSAPSMEEGAGEEESKEEEAPAEEAKAEETLAEEEKPAEEEKKDEEPVAEESKEEEAEETPAEDESAEDEKKDS